MANRTFNGRTNSENGWPYVDEGSCTWVVVPGTNVTLQIQNGQPLAIMRAFAADFNAHVEPLRDPDSGCWTPGNSVATSNHPGGTAMDLNWNGPDGKTFRYGISEAQAYPGDKARKMRELIAFYEGNIFCGGDWSIRDWMHFQMAGGTYNNPKTANFIARKIRADGFSTFNRGNAPVEQPLSRADRYALLIIAEGQRRKITDRGIKIALATALVESNLTVYANERVPESMMIPHDAVGSDAYSVGIFQQQVRNTGNGWWWGDAKTCMDPTSSAGLFYDRLAGLNYNGPNSPGSYAQAVQSSAYPDRYDQRYGEAERLFDRLKTADLDPLQELLMSNLEVESLSLYATPGEPLIPLVRMLQAIDAAEHRKLTEDDARLGDADAIARIARVAAGQGKYRRPSDIAHAVKVLNEIEATNPKLLQSYIASEGQA